MKKVIKFFAWIFVAAVLSVTAALVVVSIWAATGTRDLSRYNNYIQDSINNALVGNRITIGKTYMEWNHLDELLSIKAQNVQFHDKDNNLIGSFPRITLKYGILQLLTGDFIPSRLLLIAPEIDLSNIQHQGTDSSFDLNDLNIGKLDEVSILNGVMIVPDGSRWNINRATLWYDGDIQVQAAIQKENQQVLANLRTNKDQTDSYLKVQFNNFDSDSLLTFIPEMKDMRFIANGSAVVVSNTKEKLASFKVDEMVGAFNDPNIFAEKLTIKAGKAEGTYDLNKEILDVKNFETVFDDDFNLSGNAIITTFDTYVANVSLGNLKLLNFKKYWPVPAAPNAITWIKENVKDGVVTDGTMALKLTKQEVDSGILAPNAVDIKFNFKDVASTYLPNFPPITNGVGSGAMNGTGVRLNVASAVSSKSKITRAVIDFTDFDKSDVYLSLDADVTGDVSDLASYYIELGAGKKLLGSKDNLSGNSVNNIKVRLPLLAALKISQVEYAVKSKITDATIKNLLDSFDATKATVDITADQNSYSAIGQCYATYNRPGDLTLTNAPISFEVGGKGQGLRIAVASDITNSAAEFAPLGLKKSAGEKGKFVFEVVDNGQVPQITKAMLDSDAIRVNAKGTLKKDYSNVSSLELAAKFGKTDLVGKVSNNQVLSIDLKGPYVDAAPIIRHLKNDKSEDEDDTAFKLRLKADEVGLMNGQSLKNAYVTLSCAKDCDVISLNSQKVSFNQTSNSLIAKASNTGSLLKGFDIYPNMISGDLEINAKVNGSDYDGRLVITDFRIAKAQTLAKMLTLGSLTGIADTLTGKGISFKKLATNFTMTKKKIGVKDFRMVGSAIGITANGEVDRDTEVAELSGNIIPAYTANTLLGKIPLIGDVIIGSDGVFALAYSLKGNMDDPSLSVNPLSVLAPGFLKNIFQ